MHDKSCGGAIATNHTRHKEHHTYRCFSLQLVNDCKRLLLFSDVLLSQSFHDLAQLYRMTVLISMQYA